eukprot:m.348057 g.348057  ORF g.348057 m.348057 type:complete len:274 (+) comp55864_c1_seq1:878-1699(+)
MDSDLAENRRLRVKECLLALLNIFYLVAGVTVIAVAAVAKSASAIATLSILEGLVFIGVFLLLLSILGFIASRRRTRGLLFTYMGLLGLVFVLQVSISIAVLVFSPADQLALVRVGWCDIDDYDKVHIQSKFNCFGFDGSTQNPNAIQQDQKCMFPGMACPTKCYVPTSYCNGTTTTTTTTTLTTTTTSPANTTTTTVTTATTTTAPYTGRLPVCPPCEPQLRGQISAALKKGGGVALGLSFTELAGVALAYSLWKRKQAQQTAAGAKYRGFL